MKQSPYQGETSHRKTIEAMKVLVKENDINKEEDNALKGK